MPKITELDSVISLDGNDVLPIVSKNNNNEDETMKIAVNAIGTKLLNSNEYGALNTTDKKIIGAINEVNTKASQFDNMTATASGSIATFDNGGDDIPVSEFECEIVAQQASGTPTPTSPLPITGFSQADITVTDNDQIANLYTVSFGQTIYGGRLIYDGQWSIEATHGVVTLNSADRQGFVAGSYYAYDNVNGKPADMSQIDYATAICDKYVCATSSSERSNGKFYLLSGTIIFVDDRFTDVATANSIMQSETPTVIYPLATPTIIPITSATRVKTISGDNNIYSNTGNCELKYFTNKADSLAELIKAFVL